MLLLPVAAAAADGLEVAAAQVGTGRLFRVSSPVVAHQQSRLLLRKRELCLMS
jgi:hypothetical protein